MGTSRTVTNEQIAQVVHLREAHDVTFDAIGAAMGGWSRQRASDIYYYYRKKPLPSEYTIRTPVDDLPIAPGGHVPDRTPADHAVTRADAPPPSPSARRYLGSLADDILHRIQSQGLTAGLFGDPPKGRSALDKKLAGIHA